MKRFILTPIILIFCFSQFLNGQQNTDTLNGNSVAATIFDQGRLFKNFFIGGAGYELPAGSGNHLIFSATFLFGGTNQNSDLKLAADLFGQGNEFYCGPYSSTHDYSNPSYIYSYESRIWKVKKSDIIYHINNYTQLSYVAPDDILNWPGNGDPSLGVSQQLAPYVDVNNNGIYEPYKGDYPCIKGDEAVFQIMNEDRPHLSSGGEKIGAEIHMMIYQIQASNYIDSTTFIDVKVINKGQNEFNDFKTLFFIDSDIGFPEDDRIGSAPSKNLMYAYNESNNDSGSSPGTGYGTNPPTVGVVSLNKTMAYSGYFSRPDLAPLPSMTNPSSSADYWNYMNGKWLDGSEWTYGGFGHGGTSGTTQHMFDGNPYLGTGWTELDIDGNGNSTPAGDRRFFIVSNGENFLPGDTLTYNYAIIANRQGDNIENVQGLINYADSVQQFFDNSSPYCTQYLLSTTDLKMKEAKLNIYPNPATNQINIVWENLKIEDISIYSLQGKLIKRVTVKNSMGHKIIGVNGLSSGIYLINVGNTVRKLIIK